MDESTDASDTTKLAVFIRSIDSEFTITEKLLSLVSMKGTTTGKDLFDAVLKVMLYFNQDYKLLEGITTDGVPSMMEKINGIAVRLEKYVVVDGGGSLLKLHCIIQQQKREIIMVIFKCYFQGEHIALSINKKTTTV